MQNDYVKRTGGVSRLVAWCVAVWLLATGGASAQQVNTAFRSGETLQYNLYYNWKFVWVKAGSATMSVTTTTYGGEPAYRTRLLMRGSQQADNMFVLRDTLTSVVNQATMHPLYYAKTDLEGEKHRQRYVWYTYDKDGTVHIRQRYINSHGEVTNKTEVSTEEVYDMLSFLLRARSFDASQFKAGQRIPFLMTDGDGKEPQTLIFRGRETVKLKTGVSYRCLKLSFVQKEGKKNKEKEVVTFYVTDDLNHVPVRLDLHLRFGNAKAYLSGYKDLLHPMTAKK